MNSPFRGFYLFFCGMCMGASDLIPGISGGTIAFIMGFYAPLLESLKSFNYATLKLLLRGEWSEFAKRTNCQFLLTLLSGIALSFILMANAIHFLLGHPLYRTYLYSAFLGLILASFYFCMRQVKHWSFVKWSGLGIGLITAFLLTSLSFSQQEAQKSSYAFKMEVPYGGVFIQNYNFDHKLITGLSAATLSQLMFKQVINGETLIYNHKGEVLGPASQFAIDFKSSFFDIWIIVCGAIAICALLLPGISGSYLLTLLGVYPLIIGSLAEWVWQLKKGLFDVESFGVLFNLGVGVLIGAALFARLLSGLLKNYPDLTLATLSGFMIGAIRSIWPFWSYHYNLVPLKLEKGLELVTVEPILPPLYSFEMLVSLFWLAAGFLIFFGLEASARRKVISQKLVG